MLTLNDSYTIVRTDNAGNGDAEFNLSIQLRDALRNAVENPPKLSSIYPSP